MVKDDLDIKDWTEKFIIDVLTRFYTSLVKGGIKVPLEITDKYRNPNPLCFYKVYSEKDILILHYMLNEGLINGVIKLKVPLLIKGSITKKGYQYLMIDKFLEI